MEDITTSSARTYSACKRLYQIKYVHKIASVKKSTALRRGSLVHLGLNAWWKNPDLDQMLAVVKAQEADVWESVKVQEMLRGYHYRWVDTSEYEVLEIEQKFDIPIINPSTGRAMRDVRLSGMIDVRCEDLIVEHKSTTMDISAGSPYWRRLALDNQISNYLLATGVDRCLYDVLKSPTQRPLKATPEAQRKYKADGTTLHKNQRKRDETTSEYRERIRTDIAANPDKYYQRGMIVRFAKELVEAQYDLLQQAQMIRESHNTGRWPRNPDACMNYNQECAFFDVCCGAASLDDPIRFRHKKSQHEELS